MLDPHAERDALILLTGATFIGCVPLVPHLPEKSREILTGSLRRAFMVLGLDFNDESNARRQLAVLQSEVLARRGGKPGAVTP